MAEVRSITPSDYEDIAAFLARHQTDHHPASHWLTRLLHWWDRNPATHDESRPGWFLGDRGRVVGFLGAIPLHVSTPHGPARSVSTTTFWVLPEYRSHSLRLFVRSLGSDFVAHVNTTANDLAAPLFEHLRFSRFPGAYRGERRVLVLDGPAVTKKLLQGRLSRGLAAATTMVLSPPSRLAVAALQQVVARRGTLPWAELDPTDPRLDELWSRSSVSRRFTAVRTRAVMGWFSEGLEPPKALLGCFHSGRLAGFVLLVRHRDPDLNLVECADLFVGEERGEVVASLVAAAAQWAAARRLGGVIFHPFDQLMADTLRGMGLLRQRLPRVREYIRLPAGSALDLSEKGCYLTHLLGDRFLS
jgi:hypothetical protein